MKTLLFITQKVDDKDAVLGFVHNWITKLASEIPKIKVICLEKGSCNLPENVEVYSLGKEENKSKSQYISRFFKYIFKNDYDSVFVHMNKEYVFLGFWFWKIKNKKVALWYNHTMGSIFTHIAMMLTDTVFHTSPYAFTANSRKSKKMPAGIDTNKFHPVESVTRQDNSILYLGRLDKVKNVDLLIEAADILNKKGVNFKVNIYGKASKGSERYEEKLKKLVKEKELEEIISFHDQIPNSETPEVYSAHSVFVNMTPKGNYDKTVLEAMACETLVVASSLAFQNSLKEDFIFQENNVEDFAEKLEYTLSLQDGDRWVEAEKLKNYVLENESLDMTINKIKEIMS